MDTHDLNWLQSIFFYKRPVSNDKCENNDYENSHYVKGDARSDELRELSA